MGQVFGGLTRTGVEGQPGRTPTYFDSPGEAAISAAQQTRVPTTVLNSGGTVQAPTLTAQESGGFTPAMHKPSFPEASGDGMLSPGLTTKGKVLATLLTLGQGAAVGAGQPSFGAGFEKATLFPLQQRRIQQNITQDELQNEAQRQAIEQGPVLFKSRVDAANANAEADKARAGYYKDRGESNDFINVPGVGLVRKPTADSPAEVVQPAPTPGPRLFGNPTQGIVAVDPKTMTPTEVRPPNPKPQSAPKAQKQGNAQAVQSASRLLEKHGNDREAALADFNAQLANSTNEALIRDAKDIILAIRTGGSVKKRAGR